MMEQTVVFSVLLLTLAMFMWGKFRHDIIALSALIILVLFGIIPAEIAFSGFSHPAVITVAAVLMVSRGMQNSGLVDLLGNSLTRIPDKPVIQVLVLTCVTAAASAVMNNVGALAILMPAAIQMARKSSRSPSYILMPLAFGSLFGGMITLIGTPPNIIIASLRAQHTGSPFGMFDFSPVGAGLAAAGILFISFIGWRLLPSRAGEQPEEDRFRINDYITEVRVKKESVIKGKSIREIRETTDTEVEILGLIRNNQRIHSPSPSHTVRTNDILILKADSDHLKEFVTSTQVVLAGKRQFRKDAAGSDDISILEVVVKPNSPMITQTASSMNMRTRFGVNLLAAARHEKTLRQRLDEVKFQAGDVLLIQGRTHTLDDAVTSMGCLPLADRNYSVGEPRKIALSVGIFGLAIVTVVAGFLQVHVAFTLAALCMVFTRILPARDMYSSIDWPVIILLGAMLPVGGALESSGGAALAADQVLKAARILPLWATLALLLVITMIMSGVINNAATVVLMAPVAVFIAQGLQTSLDPFFMTIAVGASAAFLTPVGHQSNTLVMGPGGYKFTDYLKLGIPLTLLVSLFGVLLILLFWM